LSFGVRKPKKKKKTSQTAPRSPHVVWEGFKKNYPSSSKNTLQHINLSDMTGMCFLAANTQYGFGEDRDKKYPTAVYLMLWAYISAGGPGHLV